MEYTKQERLSHQTGKKWYGHHVTTYYRNTDDETLFDFLTDTFGPKSEDRWRAHGQRTLRSRHYVVRFQSRSDAMHFMIQWNEKPPTINHDFDLDFASLYPHQIMAANIIISQTPSLYPTPYLKIFQHKGRGIRHSGPHISYKYVWDPEPKPYWYRETIDGDIMSTDELMERLKNENR